jgi:hypothetical protein
LVNGLFMVVASGREGKAESGGEVLWTLACGLGATIIEIGVIGLVRAQITQALGLPF